MMGEFAIKVSPFSGEYSGGALRGKDTSCGWGWCEPILVGGLTYIGCYYLPKEGVGVQVAEAMRTGVKLRSSEQLCKTR